jgi:hypothetical protein
LDSFYAPPFPCQAEKAHVKVAAEDTGEITLFSDVFRPSGVV